MFLLLLGLIFIHNFASFAIERNEAIVVVASWENFDQKELDDNDNNNNDGVVSEQNIDDDEEEETNGANANQLSADDAMENRLTDAAELSFGKEWQQQMPIRLETLVSGRGGTLRRSNNNSKHSRRSLPFLNVKARKMPCCTETIGTHTCTELRNRHPLAFRSRCKLDADFAILQCCRTCRTDVAELGRVLFENGLKSRHCFDRHNRNYCSNFIHQSGIWAAGAGRLVNCNGEGASLAFRVCRRSCGFCEPSLYQAQNANCTKGRGVNSTTSRKGKKDNGTKGMNEKDKNRKGTSLSSSSSMTILNGTTTTTARKEATTTAPAATAAIAVMNTTTAGGGGRRAEVGKGENGSSTRSNSENAERKGTPTATTTTTSSSLTTGTSAKVATTTGARSSSSGTTVVPETKRGQGQAGHTEEGTTTKTAKTPNKTKNKKSTTASPLVKSPSTTRRSRPRSRAPPLPSLRPTFLPPTTPKLMPCPSPPPLPTLPPIPCRPSDKWTSEIPPPLETLAPLTQATITIPEEETMTRPSTRRPMLPPIRPILPPLMPVSPKFPKLRPAPLPPSMPMPLPVPPPTISPYRPSSVAPSPMPRPAPKITIEWKPMPQPGGTRGTGSGGDVGPWPEWPWPLPDELVESILNQFSGVNGRRRKISAVGAGAKGCVQCAADDWESGVHHEKNEEEEEEKKKKLGMREQRHGEEEEEFQEMLNNNNNFEIVNAQIGADGRRRHWDWREKNSFSSPSPSTTQEDANALLYSSREWFLVE